MKQELDFSDCEPSPTGEFDDRQLKLRIGCITPLSVLPDSRGKDSSLFIETNGRGTNSRFARNFADLHLNRSRLT